MEEKLAQVKSLMELEKQKRSSATKGGEGGTIWRSATQNAPLAGYDKVVMERKAVAKKPP